MTRTLSMFQPWALVLDRLEESAVFLAHLPRLHKRSRTLFVQAPKVVLNVLDVEIEILSDEIAELFRGIWVARNERPCWREARLSVSATHQAPTNDCSLRDCGRTQPEVSQTPYFLE